MMDPWFERRPPRNQLHPLDWRGWSAVAVFLIFEAGLVLALVVAPAMSGTGPTDAQAIWWGVLAVAGLLLFVFVTRRKSTGTASGSSFR